MSNLRALSDDALEAAADGEAARILEDRRQQREQQQQQRRQQQAVSAAKQAIRSMPAEDLETVAENPRTDDHPDRGWALVDPAVWDAGYGKEQVVQLAREERSRRERARRVRRKRARQPVRQRSVFDRQVDIFGHSVPAWLLVVLVVGGVFLASGGDNGR